MTSEVPSLSTLIHDVTYLIVFGYLDDPSRASLALTSKKFRKLIIRTQDDAIHLYSTNFFLHCVKYGYGFLLAWGLKYLPHLQATNIPLVQTAMAHTENQNLRTIETIFEASNDSLYEDLIEIYATVISRLPQNPDVFKKIWSLKSWKSLTINTDLEKCTWIYILHDSLIRKGCIKFVQMAMEEKLSDSEILRKGLQYWFPRARKDFATSLMLVIESDNINPVRDLYDWHFGSKEQPEGDVNRVLFEALYGILGRLHASPNLLKWCRDYYQNSNTNLSLNSIFNTEDSVNRGFLIDGTMNVTISGAAKLLFSDPTFFRTLNTRTKVAVLRSLLNSAIQKLDCDMFSTFMELAKEVLNMDQYYRLLRKRFIENDFISPTKSLLPLPLPTNDTELREKFSRFILHVLELTPNFNGTILRLVEDTSDVVNVEWLVLFGNKALLERLLFVEKLRFDPDVLMNVFLRYAHIQSFVVNDIYLKCIPDYILNFENLEFLYENGFRIRDLSQLENALASPFIEHLIFSMMSRPQFIHEFDLLTQLFGDSYRWLKSLFGEDIQNDFVQTVVTYYQVGYRGAILKHILKNAEYFWVQLGFTVQKNKPSYQYMYCPDSDADDPILGFFQKICPDNGEYFW